MKTYLKALLIMQTFGWIPFIIIKRFPVTDVVSIIIICFSLILLATSMLLFIMLFSNKAFWKSVKQLEKSEEKLRTTIAEYSQAKQELVNISLKLSRKILEFDKS